MKVPPRRYYTTGGATHKEALVDERTLKRFWSKINKDGPTVKPELGPCWEWTAGKAHYGYGKFTQTELAHRLTWQLRHGEITGGLWVLHKCDHTACCNPDHLFLGNHQDNVDDKVSKGRQPRGDWHGKSKITEADAREVRRLYAEGALNQREIAARIGAHYCTVWDIIHGKAWRHVK